MSRIMPDRSSIVKNFRKPFPYPLKHVVYFVRSEGKPRPFWQIARKSLTVCAGFIAKDGLLLAADTEITGAGKYDAAKIRRLKFASGEYVITGAGNVSFIGMASDMIAEKLRKNKHRFVGSFDRRKGLFFSLVRDEVLWIHERYIVPYLSQGNTPWFTLILGLQLDGAWNDPYLMHVASDGGVYWAADDIIEGSGADIARRFSTILCRERLPLDVLRSVAIFCLYQAKQGAIGVGGSTYSYIFPSPRTNTLWDEKTLVRETEESLRLCLVESRDRSVSVEKFRERANEFVQRLVAIREDIERSAVSQQFILETLRKEASPASFPNVPEPRPEQSGGAAPGSGS